MSADQCGYCRAECPIVRAQVAKECPFANAQSEPDEPTAPACTHAPDRRCFDCATDDELASAIPPWPGGAA